MSKFLHDNDAAPDYNDNRMFSSKTAKLIREFDFCVSIQNL